MLRIYIARHGQDEDNANGILNGLRDKQLTDLGRKQAREMAEKIKNAGIKFNKIYTSPLIRTYQTAEIFTDILGLTKPEKLDFLIERNFGIMTGQPHTKILEMCMPNVITAPSGVNYFLSPEGAETFPEMMKRGRKLLDWLKTNHSEGNLLLVTHGDYGKLLYATYYKLDWKKVLVMFHFGNSDLLLLAPNSPADEVFVFKTEQYNL